MMIMEQSYGKLPKVFKGKLLEALRSGIYKKCNGQLRRRAKGFNSSNQPYEFCVLGVIADIAGATFKNEGGGGTLGDVTGGKIPVALKRNTGGLQSKLYCMNDAGTSFDKIADWIEKTL